MAASLDSVYDDYLHRAGERPRRTRREIRAAVQARDLTWDAVDDAFWASLVPAWLAGTDDTTPFRDGDAANSRYRQIAMQIGLLD